ncbi:hypothetical protein ALC53_09480 [Atta colombica]|uniref:Uncharacterized protein n=1 Tax=Atta colombica TaxID=520822 RepID=A0A151I1I5_9HYME|nr:hypothetical protein ALC53_09480 [Atta colombica]
MIETDLGIYEDIIAKVESLWRDQVYAINKLGLQDKIKPDGDIVTVTLTPPRYTLAN